ncbi:MAG TPA: hypothetical protein VFA18_16005 [Gemmataceae bacterium]|nr:hypothetical protein [Gemmataceae bacterium]
MAQESDVIRRNIDVTRSSLTEKLETLECQVKGTMEEARSTVEDTLQTARCTVENTMESVRSTVDHTVAAVKRTFDVRLQTEQHPWPMVGGSVVAGFVAGVLVGRQLMATHERQPNLSRVNEPFVPPPSRPEPAAQGPSWVERMAAPFQSEIQEVKSLAVSTLFGVIRDLAKQAIPPNFHGQVEHIMNDLTTKFGGKPVEGSVFEQPERPMADMAGSRRW